LRNLSEVLPAFLTHHRAFPGAFLCPAVLILTFRLFRRRKHLTNHRSKASWCYLDLCEGLFIVQICRCCPKTTSSRTTSP
jgi:hypothetical protein